MASIDDVIARSREPGEFTERREFSIARGQAIEKMRKFALVEPHYYILELIQSAVANGATYIDIQCDRTEMVMSYIGGNFTENALASLFDFLFAAEDDLEHGPLRQLALGVNALMRYEPEEIVVESGNGTLPGTSRIAIRAGADTVEVGRPNKPLEGTFVRASGLSGRPRFREKPPEYNAVVNRCLVAPVPILFNQDPVFGYSSQRTPASLYGFGNTITFDEGDLYGTIGVARRHSGAVFRLLTHGVWIESTRRPFPASRGGEIDNLGGVVTFDRLRKTADHSSIVEDERFEEMWVRLQPYVNQLVAGATENAGYDVTTLAGESLESRELIDLLRNSDSVVLAPQSAAGGQHFEAARKIGESLGAPVLCTPDDSRESLQTLGGRDVEFVIPEFDDEEVLHFYTRREEPLPPRPWLTAPVDLGTISLLDVVEPLRVPPVVSEFHPSLSDESILEETSLRALRKAAWLLGDPPQEVQSVVNWKEEQLDARGENIHATIYTPENRNEGKRSINVEVRTAGRLVWQGEADAIAPGQVLVVDVSDIAPRVLWNPPVGSDEPVARHIADGVIQKHLNELEEAADRGLRAALRSDVEPNTNAARLVLASLSTRLVKRIRGDGADQRVGFSIVDSDLDVGVLDIPVFRTIGGRAVSLRQLEALMQSCHGLVYAVRADITPDLEGLDRDRILVVDETMESILLGLVGPSAYVRVDNRDVIVEYQGVQCRDIGVGLREYPDFPLLVEGHDPSQWDETRQRECTIALVDKLIEVVKAGGRDVETQDLRRQAWRHLQWLAAHRNAYDFADQAGQKVDRLPLFALSHQRTCSFGQLREVLEHQGHVEMLDGWAVGAGERAFGDAIDRQLTNCREVLADPLGFELEMNPFVLHLLGDVAQGVAEYHLSQKEMESIQQPEVQLEAMIEQKIIDNPEARGVVGVPMVPVERPAVVVFSEETRQTVLREDVGELFGVVGKIRLRKGVEHDDVESKVATVARDVLSHLLARLPELAAGSDSGNYERALHVLLEFAADQVQLIGRQDLTVTSSVRDELALEILNVPVFETDRGAPVSALALYHDFQDRAGSAMATGESLVYEPDFLSDDLPETLRDWIRRHLCVQRIHRPACYTEKLTGSESPSSSQDPTRQCVARTLEHWINVLHPDTDVGADAALHIDVSVDSDWFDEDDRTEQFCQLVRAETGARVLTVNPDHWMTCWMIREGDQSDRAIAWPVLAAYAHINNMLEVVTNDHELICQQRVADALDTGRLAMVRG